MAKNKNKKKPAAKKTGKNKKKFLLRNFIIIIAAVVLVASVVTFIVITTKKDSKTDELRNTYWVSETAKTASGDEVDVREVYNVRYTTYQGRLIFDGENGFELWLQPGDKGDGTHTGSYKLDGDKGTAKFDSGGEASFTVIRNDGNISEIDFDYGDYIVGFFKQNNSDSE